MSRLDNDEVRAPVPVLARDLEGLYVPGGGRVDGRTMRDALLAGAAHHGARSVPGRDGGAPRVETDEGVLEADDVLVAAGAWGQRAAGAVRRPPLVARHPEPVAPGSRLTGVRKLALLAVPFAVLFVAAGCSGEVTCTAIGTPVGVGLEVRAALAARTETAAIEVCWDGSCERADIELMPSSKAGQETCSGDTCGVGMVPTGDKHGFGDVAGLPKRPVEVRLTLRGAGAGAVLERRLTLTPRGRFPNGPECGEGGPNLQLTVEADGTVRER